MEIVLSVKLYFENIYMQNIESVGFLLKLTLNFQLKGLVL